jgi:hypothetical protein
MSTIAKYEPWISGTCLSTLMPEKANQTFYGNSFVWMASGETTIQGSTAADLVVPATAKIGFALEPAHNYSVAGSSKLVEIAEGDCRIEITFNGDPTAAQIAVGSQLALTTIANPDNTYDSATQPYINNTIFVAMVPDVDNVAMVRVVDIAGRGILSNGKATAGTPMHTGDDADVNPRIIVEILPAFRLTK